MYIILISSSKKKERKYIVEGDGHTYIYFKYQDKTYQLNKYPNLDIFSILEREEQKECKPSTATEGMLINYFKVSSKKPKIIKMYLGEGNTYRDNLAWDIYIEENCESIKYCFRGKYPSEIINITEERKEYRVLSESRVCQRIKLDMNRADHTGKKVEFSTIPEYIKEFFTFAIKLLRENTGYNGLSVVFYPEIC